MQVYPNICFQKKKILERSALLQETGAAISIAPNASPVLRSWGFDIAKARMVAIKTGSMLNGSDMQMVVPNYYANIAETYGAPIYAVHRVDLHDQLLQLATAAADAGPGEPCTLHVRAAVTEYVSQRSSLNSNCFLKKKTFVLMGLRIPSTQKSPRQMGRFGRRT